MTDNCKVLTERDKEVITYLAEKVATRYPDLENLVFFISNVYSLCTRFKRPSDLWGDHVEEIDDEDLKEEVLMFLQGKFRSEEV